MGKQLILIVEDDEFVAAAMDRAARSAGFITAIDSSGKNAHTLARNLKPCCVLLDISLPGVDGRKILEVLKADQSTQHIPVVMNSAWEDQHMRIDCLAHGADDYEVKPPSPTLFEKLARRFIAGRGDAVVREFLKGASGEGLEAAAVGFAEAQLLS